MINKVIRSIKILNASMFILSTEKYKKKNTLKVMFDSIK